MDNSTDGSWDNLDISCEEITNHWLYFIFSAGNFAEDKRIFS